MNDISRQSGLSVVSSVVPGFVRPGEIGWVESTFFKRECARYVSRSSTANCCSCGQTWVYHKSRGVKSMGEPGEIWSPLYHTLSSPTDAFGAIDFLGGPHPNKAQFIRLGFDSRPDLIFKLLTREWGLELPKLVISVHGGKTNFELQPRLKRILHKGFLRAAKTTGAWILTGGTSTGVTRHVGDALISERSPRLRGGRVVSIGIAPWGVVENRATLIGTNVDVTYQAIDHPRSKYAVLNNRHAYFLLADNGTVGRYGAEIALRRKLEKFISSQRLPTRTPCSIPVVCLVVEGGMDTIRTVLEYVTDSPPVPVVVVEGSGRAADLIAFAHKYASETNGLSTVSGSSREQLLMAIRHTFNINDSQANRLLMELLQCVQKKDFITIFRPADNTNNSDLVGDGHELDHAILSALFRARHLSAAEQLCLALAWNRVDIARSEIFVYGQEWTDDALEEAMMEALVKNRVDFVKLLLEMGVQMARFLTIGRLEELYNSKQGPANTLRYIVRDVRPHMPRNYSYSLIDIGLVINKLMGGAYRSSYTRRKFRRIYSNLMLKKPVLSFISQSVRGLRQMNRQDKGLAADRNGKSLYEDRQSLTESSYNLFSHPFNELLAWAVLTKRQAMAKLMWQHGEEALAKALVASNLYRALAFEAADDDLEVEIADELRSYAAEFDREAFELLDYCYRQDRDLSRQLLTCELSNFSRQTCLRLAFACHHRELLAHPCSQLILGDLWLGGLRIRHFANLKVTAGLFCPPFILTIDFKSKEELQLMPQTEEERLTELKDEHENSNSTIDNSFSASPSVSLRSSRLANNKMKRSCSMRCTNAEEHVNCNRPRVRLYSSSSDLPSPSLEKTEASVSHDHIHHMVTDQACNVHCEGQARKGQLRFSRKLYRFYTAPITKFWFWTIAYFFYLLVFTYTMLIRTPVRLEWNEIYVIAHMATFGCEKVREIVATEPVKLNRKLAVWGSNPWNCCDAFFVAEFFIGFIIRLHEETMDHGRVLYCLNIVYWYIRILVIMRVSKFLGPFVTMIGWMLKRMIYYVALMLVVLMSYGVFRQSLLFPHEEFSWPLVRDIFFKPYFMIYGELFADDINPPCGNGTKPDGSFDPDMPPCETGRWLNPLLMTAYLLIVNILMLNLLIAVFNAIFLRTNVYSHQIWKFSRFAVVMEYDTKPTLPPPFIVISHFDLIVKWCRRRSARVKESYDCGLKLFLDKDDLERLYDFEEESMEGLVRERENKKNQTTDERVRVISDRLEVLSSKIDDPHRDDIGLVLDSLQSRLAMLEKAIEQTSATCLAIAHNFSAPQGTNRATRTTSTSLSDATTFMAGVMDGEKWTSSPLSSDESSSSDDQSCSELGFNSADGAVEVLDTSTLPELPTAINNATPVQRKRSLAKKTLSKLNISSTTISNLNEEQPTVRTTLFEPSTKATLKRRATEKYHRKDGIHVLQHPASASAALNNCDCFFPDAATISNENQEGLKPVEFFRSSSRISNAGRENQVMSIKVVEEAERLRQMEDHVYNMMGGVIRRRRHRDSENLDISLDEMCQSPILLDEIDASDEEMDDSIDADDSFAIDIEDPITLDTDTLSSRA